MKIRYAAPLIAIVIDCLQGRMGHASAASELGLQAQTLAELIAETDEILALRAQKRLEKSQPVQRKTSAEIRAETGNRLLAKIKAGAIAPSAKFDDV